MLLGLARCATEGGVVVVFFFFLRQHQVVYTRAIPKKHRSIVIGRTQL